MAFNFQLWEREHTLERLAGGRYFCGVCKRTWAQAVYRLRGPACVQFPRAASGSPDVLAAPPVEAVASGSSRAGWGLLHPKVAI